MSPCPPEPQAQAQSAHTPWPLFIFGAAPGRLLCTREEAHEQSQWGVGWTTKVMQLFGGGAGTRTPPPIQAASFTLSSCSEGG